MDEGVAIRHHTCMNCGLEITGKYCAACGQRDADLRRPIWIFARDFFQDVLELDTRFIHTVVPLLFQPGLMTRKYVEGKRAYYTPPLRLYLITSLLFFIIAGVADIAILKFEVARDGEGPVQMSTETEEERAAERQEAIDNIRAQLAEFPENEEDMTAGQRAAKEGLEVALENAQQDRGRESSFDVKMFVPIGDGTEQEELADELFQIDTDGSEEEQDFGDRIERGMRTAVADPSRLNDLFERWLPRAMIIVLPVFALILRMFYWGKGKRYLFNQLIFSLHFHTFMFFLLNVILVAEIFFPDSVSGWVFLGAISLYLLIGLKVMSQQGWFRTIFKFIFIYFFYTIALSIILLGAFVWGLQDL